jgi:hypothetical protein
VRLRGDVAEVVVKYLPAEKHTLPSPNHVEFNKAGEVRFSKPIAELYRDGVLRELDASGFTLVTDAGATLRVDISRCHLADKFTSLALYIESTWTLTKGDRVFKKDIRTERRHAIYGTAKKAEDFNAMVSEAYEEFFGDPQLKALLRTREVDSPISATTRP